MASTVGVTTDNPTKTTSSDNMKPLPELYNGAKFTLQPNNPQALETFCDLILADLNKKNPYLIISCFGGIKYFTKTDNLENEFRNGISQAATTKRVWVLTTGLDEGVSKFIGQSLHRYRLLNEKTPKATLIGLTGTGTLTTDTRNVLTRISPSTTASGEELNSSTKLNEDRKNTLDKHHSHFLVLRNGTSGDLPDGPRSKLVEIICEKTQCYAITIIVEGGCGTLDVILNDLNAKRPVVIIHGSGRLANILGTLFDRCNDRNAVPKPTDVTSQFKLYPTVCRHYHEPSIYDQIKEIFDPKHRDYLNVFKLERGAQLTDTIFQAVLKARNRLRNEQNINMQKEADLKFLKFAVSWNCIDEAHNILQHMQDNAKEFYPALFEQAVKENRPIFVDYLLRRHHDPLITSQFISDRSGRNNPNVASDNMARVRFAQSFILHLYACIKPYYDEWIKPESTAALDRQYYTQLIGPYVQPFYTKQTICDRIWEDFMWFVRCSGVHVINDAQPISSWDSRNSIYQKVLTMEPGDNPDIQPRNVQFGEQEMLRDLFLWSVYAGYNDIAFVILLQMNSRLTAVLIATGIARRLSLFATSLDIRHQFAQQAQDYEDYATKWIDICYRQNERLACQLLLRANPLFGNVTCMQIAISSRIVSFINTNCVNQVLSRQWYGQMIRDPTASIEFRIKFGLSLISFGLLAPMLLTYRSENVTEKRCCSQMQLCIRCSCTTQPNNDTEGIEDLLIKRYDYRTKLSCFHSSPVVRMSIHFVIYILFLLLFSYVMLFHMENESKGNRWIIFSVMIIVLAMFVEDARKIVFEYCTQTMETWHRSSKWLLLVHLLPYCLFCIGYVLYLISTVRPKLFTTARIILAIDLELWYLISLRFVSGIRILGPKLFMIRNMVRDMVAFIYIIFICITAYGVVSGSLFMYKDVEFSLRNILTTVFYRPYWFLYDIVEDEKEALDKIITSNTSTTIQITEATVTHVLFGFHMLFINILILNLLIGVFNFSINEVQEKNKYFWRYQRYELICEYVEKPMFNFPPFSVLIYFIWFIHVTVCGGKIFRVFKRFGINREMDSMWTDFEDATTYEHARTLVEEKYRSKNIITSSILTEIAEPPEGAEHSYREASSQNLEGTSLDDNSSMKTDTNRIRNTTNE